MSMAQPLHFSGGGTAPADKRYDPRYDPLVADDPGSGRAYAPTYWVATAGPAPADDGPVANDIDTDVVVIGKEIWYDELYTPLVVKRR